MKPVAKSRSLPHLAGLDGLRAIAVLAVIAYHARLPWARGGFLGVEVFFVISGYLITSLLLVEWQGSGHIDLWAFWLRRARRLLPALWLLLLATLVYAVLFLPGEVASLRGDALAALAYASNWRLIFGHKSYFETVGRPSLLQHLWSLAVEGQFYLIWPLLLAAALPLCRGRSRRLLLPMVAAGLGSSLLMAGLYRQGADPSRVYYGSDTRAAALMAGAALAAILPPSGVARERRSLLERARAWLASWLLDGLGLLGLLALAGCCIWLSEYQPLLYRGGFALVSLAATAVIAAIAWPGARLLPAMLAWRPLRWLGERSYGIYLWHWPIFALTRPGLDVPLSGWPLFALRLSATLIVAGLSYRYIEKPIRSGALARAFRAPPRQAAGSGPWWLLRWGAVTAAVVGPLLLIVPSVVSAQPPTPPPYLAVAAIDTFSDRQAPASLPTLAVPATFLVTATPAPVVLAAVPAEAEWSMAHVSATQVAGRRATLVAPPPAAATSGAAALPTSLPTPDAAPPRHLPTPEPPMLSAVGDSVLVGAAEQLQATLQEAGISVAIDAACGRQVAAGIEVLREREAANQLGQAVLIELGNNGPFNSTQFDEVMKALGKERRVIFVSVKVPRDWEEDTNKAITEGVKGHANARLLDWHAASADHPEYFWEDGIHLCPEGAKAFAQMVLDALNAP